MTLHSAFAVTHGASVIAGLDQINTQLNVQVQNDTGIGSAFPQFLAITEQKPALQFASRMIASALGITGSTGAPIDGTSNLVGYYAKLGADGLPEAGSVHTSYTLTRGLLLPRRLTCSHRRPAQLDMGTAAAEVTLQIYCAWDGTNAPIVINTASAIT